MDFTGLHINILARHTLNKNPSYAIAGSPPSPAATPPLLAAVGMEAGDMDDVRVAAGRRGHQRLGRLRGRQEVHPPRSSLISSRAHVLPPRLPPLAARSQPPPCLHAAPPVLVSIAFWFLICFSFCWKKIGPGRWVDGSVFLPIGEGAAGFLARGDEMFYS